MTAKLTKLILLAASFALLASCGRSSGGSGGNGGGGGDNPPAPEEKFPIAKEFWGEWRGLEQNSDGYYFASDFLFTWDYRDAPPSTYEERVASAIVAKYAPTNAAGAAVPEFAECSIQKIAGEENLILFTKDTVARPLYRVSSSSKLSGKAVSGSLSPTAKGRALSSAASVSLVIRNVLNTADKIEVSSGNSGAFEAAGAIAGDVYSIAAAATGGAAPPATPVAALPGETDAGIVPVPVGAGDNSTKGLPKLVLTPNSFEDWKGSGRFARPGKTSTGQYCISNPSAETISDLSWSISCTTGGSLGAGNSGTLSALGSPSWPLAAGAKTAGIWLDFTPAALPEGVDYSYESFTISYTMGQQSWTDSFKLRVYSDASLRIDLKSGYASAMIRSPIGTTAFLSANNKVDTPASRSLPYIAGDWQVVVGEPYRNSSSLTNGTPYSWSANGPLFSNAALGNLSEDPNEPNDSPSQATEVELHGLAMGKLTTGDYDFFTLRIPARTAAVEPDSLDFPAQNYEKLLDLDLALDPDGDPAIAAVWNRGSNANTRLGYYERSGGIWGAMAEYSTTSWFYINGVALKAEGGGASFLLGSRWPQGEAISAYQAQLSSGSWTTSAEKTLYNKNSNAQPSYGFVGSQSLPISTSAVNVRSTQYFGGVYDLGLAAPLVWSNSDNSTKGLGLLRYDGNAWQVETQETDSIMLPSFGVAGTTPAFLTTTAASNTFQLATRGELGTWTFESLGETSSATRPHFASRDEGGRLWIGWTESINGDPFGNPRLQRRTAAGETVDWPLPASVPVAAGQDSAGVPWVVIRQESASAWIWLLRLSRRGVYKAEPLYVEDPEASCAQASFDLYMPYVRVRERAGVIHAAWATRDSLSTTDQVTWKLYSTERSGY